MEKKTQNQSNNNKKDEWPSEKIFDVFISYRRASSKKASQRHSTSLARAIALELKLEGFTAYFDCWSNKNDYLENIKKSKYFFVLLTSYSWEKDKEEDDKERSGFEKEIAEIEKGIEDGNIDKDNVWWIEVDKSASNKKLIDEKFKDLKRKYHIDNISTIKESLIKDFIDEPKNKDRRIIRKTPRYSYERYKELCEKYKGLYDSSRRSFRRVLITALCTLFIVITILAVELIKKKAIIRQYDKQCIIFAGGGTVQQYIDSIYGVDVKQYKSNPGSKYIHLPSTAAYQLLWDDVNEESTRQYCPVVLSASKIDTKGANIEEFKKNNRKIVEYPIDSIPLKVQVFDNLNNNGRIAIDSLKELLKDTINYEIWTTAKESGTYLEYKELLKDSIDLDNLVEKQVGGRKYFNPKKLIGSSNNNKMKILLANKYYYYELNKSASNFTIISDTITQKINLYVYTVGYAKTNSDGTSTDVLVILPEAEQFLKSIECDTDDLNAVTSARDGIIVTMNKRKQQ